MPKKVKTGKNKKEVILFFLSCLGIIIILGLTSFNLDSYLNKNKVLGTQSQNRYSSEDEKMFWVEFINRNPAYLDGYLELSKLEMDSENYNSAKEYLLKASVINPNSEEIQRLNLFLEAK